MVPQIRTSAFGLLRWFWSTLCGRNKLSIPFRLHGVETGHGLDFGAQPLHIQQRNLSTEAPAMRVCDPRRRPSTVSFDPYRLSRGSDPSRCTTGAMQRKRTSGRCQLVVSMTTRERLLYLCQRPAQRKPATKRLSEKAAGLEQVDPYLKGQYCCPKRRLTRGETRPRTPNWRK